MMSHSLMNRIKIRKGKNYFVLLNSNELFQQKLNSIDIEKYKL